MKLPQPRPKCKPRPKLTEDIKEYISNIKEYEMLMVACGRSYIQAMSAILVDKVKKEGNRMKSSKKLPKLEPLVEDRGLPLVRKIRPMPTVKLPIKYLDTLDAENKELIGVLQKVLELLEMADILVAEALINKVLKERIK